MIDGQDINIAVKRIRAKDITTDKYLLLNNGAMDALEMTAANYMDMTGMPTKRRDQRAHLVYALKFGMMLGIELEKERTQNDQPSRGHAIKTALRTARRGFANRADRS